MILASLLDLGVDLHQIEAGLAGLGIEPYTLKLATEERMGISGRRFVVLSEAVHSHRGLREITRIIEDGDLPSGVRSNALEAFERIAKAEATIHGVPVETVHFHEVGAVDSIVDIVGAMLALDILGVDAVCCSPLPLGKGSISCAHGVIPPSRAGSSGIAERRAGLPAWNSTVKRSRLPALRFFPLFAGNSVRCLK